LSWDETLSRIWPGAERPFPPFKAVFMLGTFSSQALDISLELVRVVKKT
jgi:hypothetical protein